MKIIGLLLTISLQSSSNDPALIPRFGDLGLYSYSGTRLQPRQNKRLSLMHASTLKDDGKSDEDDKDRLKWLHDIPSNKSTLMLWTRLAGGKFRLYSPE